VQEPKAKFIERTRELLHPRSSKVLSEEDARQIIENVTGLFQVLKEWEAGEEQTAGQIIKIKRDTECRSVGRFPE
jgi:hypothetical protein